MEPKFNLDRPPISDEEINANKDFGELVKKFKQQSIEKARSDVSFLKNKKATYSAIIAGVTVICTVTYFAVFKKEPPKENKHDKIATTQSHNTSTTSSSNKQKKAFITPPISKLNVPYTSYKVNADKGKVIVHQKTNSKITIPQKAFVNKQGEDIVGDVEIQYREFHNQADIITSGIPMTYDSAGVRYHFESAGMIDIKGFQNGEPVFINPKKEITIEFNSQYKDDKYNMYRLDTLAQNWVYLGRDNSLKAAYINKQSPAPPIVADKELTGKENPKITELKTQLDAIPPKIEAEKISYSKKLEQLPKPAQPLKPNKSTAGRPKFELDANPKEFPELAAFKNSVFEVGEENKNYTPELSQITWNSADISEGPKKGENYYLTLRLRNRVEKLIVYPALTGADYDKALSAYESKFKDYKTALAKKETDEKRIKEEYEKKQAAFLAEQKKLNEEYVKELVKMKRRQEQDLEQQFANQSKSQSVIRIFQIREFGVYNSDCPNVMPSGSSISPVYTLNNGQGNVRPTDTYLIRTDKNLVFIIHGNDKLSFNPNESYKLCVLSGDKFYLCDETDFAAVMKSKQNKVPLIQVPQELNSPDDLRKALGI